MFAASSIAMAAPKLNLVQSKSGTRMVAAEGAGSAFDLPEPPWCDDAKVRLQQQLHD